jgi:hypothetical protein
LYRRELPLSIFQGKRAATRQRAAEAVAGLHFPYLPTPDEVLALAMTMLFPDAPDGSTSRHMGLILDATDARLCPVQQACLDAAADGLKLLGEIWIWINRTFCGALSRSLRGEAGMVDETADGTDRKL